MTNGKSRLLAVLIDAENVSHKFAEAIFQEIATFGEASVRRVYGDAATGLGGWDDKLMGFGLVAHHQPPNTRSKNASDIALVIDAMDLMHSGRFDGFVLVSSDSDFTRLAQRLREQGLDVYGMGEQKTPEAFRAACKRFIFVENLESQPSQTPVKADKQQVNHARQLLENAYGALDGDENGWIGMGALGSQLSKAYPDFDTRTYGFKRLSDLAREVGVFDIDGAGPAMRLRSKGGK